MASQDPSVHKKHKRRAISWIKTLQKSAPVSELLKHLGAKHLSDELAQHLDRSGVCTLSKDRRTILYTAKHLTETTAAESLRSGWEARGLCVHATAFEKQFHPAKGGDTVKESMEKLQKAEVVRVVRLSTEGDEEKEESETKSRKQKRAHKPPPDLVHWVPPALRSLRDVPIFRDKWSA